MTPPSATCAPGVRYATSSQVRWRTGSEDEGAYHGRAERRVAEQPLRIDRVSESPTVSVLHHNRQHPVGGDPHGIGMESARENGAVWVRRIGAPFVCEGATILDDVLVIERREDAHLVLDRLRDTAEMHRRDWAGRHVSRRDLGRVSP